MVFLDAVPTSGKNHDVVGVPIEPVQSTDGGHRVVPNLFEGEPHFAKAQGRHFVAHDHGHTWRINRSDVVRPEVGPRGHHAAFQTGHLHPGHTCRQLLKALGHRGPEGFVVSSGDHDGPPWIGRATHLNGALHKTRCDPFVQQGRQHRRAQVGAVIEDIGVRRSLALQVPRRDRRVPVAHRRHGARHGIRFKTIGIGQRPRGDVVGEAVAQFGIGVHEDLQQTGLRLTCVDDEVASLHAHFFSAHRGIVESAAFRRGCRTTVFDPVGVEEGGQPRQFGRVVGRGDHVPFVGSPRRLEISTVKSREFLQHAVGVHPGRFNGGQSALFVVEDAVGERQCVTDGGFNGASGPAAAPLLVSHPNGPLEHGPSVSIRRVQQVKHLAREVQGSALVEVPRVVCAYVVLAFPLPWRDDLVVGLCGRGKVVRAVDALLVKVDMHLRLPCAVERCPGLGFPLGLPGQIAVHVEHVMVGTSAWPRLVVFPGLRIHIGSRSVRLVLEMDVPVAAIGIHTGVEHDDGAVEEFAVACRQGFDRRHGGFGADSFVAMDVVAEVHPNHPLATVHAFIHAAHVVGPQRIEAVHVFGRRHDQAQQGTALCRRSILLQFPMRHDLRHVFEVVDDQMVAGERFAEFMPDDGLRVGLANPRKGGNEHKNGGKKPAAVGPRIHDDNIGRRGEGRSEMMI